MRQGMEILQFLKMLISAFVGTTYVVSNGAQLFHFNLVLAMFSKRGQSQHRWFFLYRYVNTYVYTACIYSFKIPASMGNSNYLIYYLYYETFSSSPICSLLSTLLQIFKFLVPQYNHVTENTNFSFLLKKSWYLVLLFYL